MRHRVTRCAGLLAVVIASVAVVVPGANAASSEIVDQQEMPDRSVELGVYSAAMDTVNRVRVLRAADPKKPAPTLYLLNGVSGGSDGNWLDKTDAADFFRDKQVNVVMPIGGAGSYFADWRADDPILGKQRWSTFLTKELPTLIDHEFRGTGKNAIAGISMAGTSVFQLALRAPGLYRAIGSYSGCVRTSDPNGKMIVNAVVSSRMGNAANMWGPPSDPAWIANDPYVNAEQLRGTAIYLSSGTGVPGPHDNPLTQPDPLGFTYQLLLGVSLEAVTNLCTQQLLGRLSQLHIPATAELRPNGTHSWAYWQDDLHRSWPLFADAFGTF
ncbi:alpha/beta hydrolase [Nocardia camponoti]|uniref:Esterase n=1 Tax=Nocardia camponoti TaxID=1616106 RepID=A0A917QIM9_9NOCA|nr:alpha/beta hydrolase family protein [Nocardia camponoti]GGK50762.1 esterase [Nocardia camponoti]